jgi:hypothetical protein
MPTLTETQIAALQMQLLDLQQQHTAEQALLADPGTENLRELAVALHTMFCTSRHPGPDCRWDKAETPDDPNLPMLKWASGDHGKWLGIAKKAIMVAQGIGFTITDPDAP